MRLLQCLINIFKRDDCVTVIVSNKDLQSKKTRDIVERNKICRYGTGQEGTLYDLQATDEVMHELGGKR